MIKAKIIGQKVILRCPREKDLVRFAKWLSNPQVNRYLSHHGRMTLRKEREWFKQKRKENDLILAIDTKGGQHIGSTGLTLDRKNQRGTFGIFIGEKKSWNQGLGTEVTKLIINYGFRQLRLNRIELRVFPFNKRAIKVYKRLGFKKEGYLRQDVKKGKRYFDSILMGILKSEWDKKNETFKITTLHS